MVKMGLGKSIVLTIAIVSALATGGQAAFAENLAKEPAPPSSFSALPPGTVQPLAIYSGYTYLLASSIALQDNVGTFKISVTTSAKSTVDTVGATVQLQRYTGTAWINVGTATTKTASDTDYLSAYVEKGVITGYFYRAKVTHYVTEGSTTESVVEYSPSLLAS